MLIRVFDRQISREKPMADIVHEFTVRAPLPQVFQLFSTPEGLAKWWTKTSTGDVRAEGEFRLYFGPEFDWRAAVTRYVPPTTFELQMTDAHPDWMGTRVGCELAPEGNGTTRVRFYHTGWPEQNEHWRVSCYCWAMYLRILRRNLEHGEFVEYERRLDA
jgi:uncharacterized protein YndB with AHSA1/START domain